MRRLFLLLITTFIVSACTGTLTPVPLTPDPPTPGVATVTSTLESTPTETPPPTATETPAPTETPTSVAAPSFPNPENYQWLDIGIGFERPVDIQNAGDGSGRLFVVEQPGRIRIIQDGQLLEASFLDISERVNDSGNEQGLLGLAFHPRYEQNGFFYVNYTDESGNTVIARYQVTGDPNIADPNSEKQLLNQEQPFPNHNGGVVTFGPDGYLYLGLGDGGSQGDPFGNGQSREALLGKILRIDVDNGEPYAIPPDNPFGNEIWALGLRNPWRMSFDSGTGDIWIGDVGQNAWEEIDYLPSGSPGGANFGWNIMEGSHPYEGEPRPELILPVAEYTHGEGCSVTGGYVYRGAMPEWQGIYLYGDYCSGVIWGLIKSGGGWQNQVLFGTNLRISTFGVDESNELYLASLTGPIYKLVQR
jgi:glucose/arabinose dehydrogenase